MANLHITENRVAARLENSKAAITRQFMIVGLPVVGILSLFALPLFPLWLGIWALLLASAKQTPANAKLEVGARGERHVQEVLSHLPAEYSVYNQVPLPNSLTGRVAEADFVVTGPNGVFIVENKDYRGSVVGSEYGDKWTLHKVGQGGTPYTALVTNPVRQVKRHTAILGQFFRERGVKAWITPLVALSRNNGTSCIDSLKVKVVPAWELNTAIVGHPGRIGNVEREGAERVIEELRDRNQQPIAPAPVATKKTWSFFAPGEIPPTRKIEEGTAEFEELFPAR